MARPIQIFVGGGGPQIDLPPEPLLLNQFSGVALGEYVSAVPITAATQTNFTGLVWPGFAGAGGMTIRFQFNSPPPIYPMTYLWQYYPYQQTNHYYTNFFWGNNGSFDGLNWAYYGPHLYPYCNNQPANVNGWEIAIQADDFCSGTTVVYEQWYQQAFRARTDGSNNKLHDYYYDFPNGLFTHNSDPTWNNTNPPSPCIVWGDAPWNPGQEVNFGIVRGLQIYDADLTVSQMQAELASPGSVRVPWYINTDPTPSDISDKSGNGNHPVWIGAGRPTLWQCTVP